MAREETLYRRKLRRPLDEQAKRKIDDEIERHRHEIPGPSEFSWDARRPILTISSPLASLIVSFVEDHITVSAQMSWAARLLATDSQKQRAVRMLDAIVDRIGL